MANIHSKYWKYPLHPDTPRFYERSTPLRQGRLCAESRRCSLVTQRGQRWSVVVRSGLLAAMQCRAGAACSISCSMNDQSTELHASAPFHCLASQSPSTSLKHRCGTPARWLLPCRFARWPKEGGPRPNCRGVPRGPRYFLPLPTTPILCSCRWIQSLKVAT